MKNIWAFLLVFCLFTAIQPVYTQINDSLFITEEEFFEMDIEQLMNLNINIQVVSSKGDNIFNSPSVVSVVNREQIELYGFQTLSEVLNIVSGMSVTRTYLKRNLPTSRGVLQEHYANKVLLMIDGVPVWNAVTGEGIVDRMNINDVERVEVLKGPASVLYGTNAYAGAINVVLRKMRPAGAEAHLGICSSGAINAGANVKTEIRDLSVLVSANSHEETGPSYTFVDEDSTEGIVHDYLNTRDFLASIGYRSHSILFQAYHFDESYLGVTPRFREGMGKNHSGLGYLVNYQFNKEIAPWYTLETDIHYDFNKRNLSRSADDNIRADIAGYKTGIGIKNIFSLSRLFNLELGADGVYRESLGYDNYNVRRDSIITHNNMNGRSAWDLSGFAQLGFRYEKLSVVAGGRYTYNEFSFGDFSGRLALIYSLSKKSSLKLIYGESYRSPSLFEQNFRTPTNTVVGNINLDPEKSRALELAYMASIGQVWFQLTGYWAVYDNKIQRVRDSVDLGDTTLLVLQYRNVNDFDAKGVEMEFRYSNPGKADAFLNYSYVLGSRSDNVAGHYNFKYIPEHSIAAGGSVFFLKNFSWSVNGNLVSSTVGPSQKVNAQKILNSNLNFRHKTYKMSFVHSVGVKNILDGKWDIPEYTTRNTINTVPYGGFRYVYYSLRVSF